MRISLRGVLIALVVLVAIGGLISTGALSTSPKSSAVKTATQSGFCKSDGVSLVVDYGNGSDKDPDIFCGSEFEGSGWDLFAATGQTVIGTSEYPIGFVCRINDFPSSADQPCTSTPTTAQGTWAYYYATSELGNNWMFSAAGASMRNPKCGDVDAWVFIGPGEENREPSLAPVTLKCLN